MGKTVEVIFEIIGELAETLWDTDWTLCVFVKCFREAVLDVGWNCSRRSVGLHDQLELLLVMPLAL